MNTYTIVQDESNFEVMLNGVEVQVCATRREAEEWISNTSYPEHVRNAYEAFCVGNAAFTLEQFAAALAPCPVTVAPRADSQSRDDGLPYWYDVSLRGVVVGNIYHSWSVNTYNLEIGGVDYGFCRTLQEVEAAAKRTLI